MSVEFIYALMQEFALIYPLFMAYLWMLGGIYYYYHWEGRGQAGGGSAAQPGPLPGCFDHRACAQ